MIETIAPDEYANAWRHGCLIDLSDTDLVLLSGVDRKDLLHRMTTNDVMALAADRAVSTIFTTEKARIIERVLLVDRGEQIRMLCSPGSGDRLIRRVEKYTIMEDVRCTDISGTVTVLFVGGFDARKFLSNVFDAHTMPDGMYQTEHVQRGGGEWIVVKTEPLCGDGYLAISGDRSGDTAALLKAAASDAKLALLSREQAEVLRIEHGYPASGRELTEEINPLDASLESSVSYSKGCYIGQEVIARLTTYKKVQRALVGFQTGTAAPIEPKSSIVIDGVDVGWTSSAALHPVSGKTIGLGFVRVEYAMWENEITIRNGNSLIAGKIVRLPFRN